MSENNISFPDTADTFQTIEKAEVIGWEIRKFLDYDFENDALWGTHDLMKTKEEYATYFLTRAADLIEVLVENSKNAQEKGK